MSKKHIFLSLTAALLTTHLTTPPAQAWLSVSVRKSPALRELFSQNLLPEGYHTYLTRLPRLHVEEEDSLDTCAGRICAFIQSFDPHPQMSSSEVLAMRKKVEERMEAGLPLEMMILGFSCKSANTVTKVLSEDFDLGDYVGLATLNHLAESISRVYKPGATVTIQHCEPFLAEMNTYMTKYLGVPLVTEKGMVGYAQALRRLITRFPHLRLGEDLTNTYEAEAEHKSSMDPSAVKGCALFFKNELNHPRIVSALTKKLKAAKEKGEVSKSQIDKALKEMGGKLAEIYDKGVTKFRALLVKSTPSHMVRLSVHGSESRSGITLIQGSEGVPWHNVPYVGETVSLIKKQAMRPSDHTQSLTVSGVLLGYVEASPVEVRVDSPLDDFAKRMEALREAGLIPSQRENGDFVGGWS